MKRIGIISDTHSYINEKALSFFDKCDEIWHAGDIGDEQVLQTLQKVAPVRAVFGNIDDTSLRHKLPQNQIFKIEDINVLMTHIGGYPGKYQAGIIELIKRHQINLFISGHSHILKVMRDESRNLLHINPGAFGKSGFHRVNTLVRFEIDGSNFKNLEILEQEKFIKI
ncbi:MAG: metallophosphoesterase family protein [Bacteroidales bacterium]|nr:metallophosphoesterase family protein [Bacteroidales bacterium]